MKKKGVANIQMNSKYIIVSSETAIKKQSKEYTILWVGLPTLFVDYYISGGKVS